MPLLVRALRFGSEQQFQTFKILRSGAAGLPGAEPQPADIAEREPLRRAAQPRLPRARLQQDRQDRRGRLQGAGK